jgi:hypothetical protein
VRAAPMIVKRLPDQLTRWSLYFDPVGDTWIANCVPGYFKHVSAIGYSERCRTWVWFDVRYGRTEIVIYPAGEETEREIAARTAGCSVLQMEARPGPLRLVGFRFWCVPAMASLVGIARCGALPDQFWRCCLRNGAQVILDGRRQGVRGDRLRSSMAGNRRHERPEPHAAAGAVAGGKAAAASGGAVRPL